MMTGSLCALLAVIVPLRIVPNKIVYREGESGCVTVVVTNRDQSAEGGGRAVVAESWGLDEGERTIWTGEIALGPGEGRSFKVDWPGSAVRYGHELRVTIGRETRAEYFNVNDDWWRVNQGCEVGAPPKAVTPGLRHLVSYYGYSPEDVLIKRTGKRDRWSDLWPGWGPFRGYWNLETRWQMQMASVGGNRVVSEQPDDKFWYTPNGSGDRRRRTGDIRRDTQVSHDWGLHQTRYTINLIEGPYGFELIRKKPYFALRNDRGQFQGLFGATQPTDIADLGGSKRHPWTYVEANFFREDVLEFALDDLAVCITDLHEDGVYFDGRYMSKHGHDAFGNDLANAHDVEACVVRNMRRSREKIFAANPKAYIWSNGSHSDNPEMALADHPQCGLLHEVQWPFLLNPTRLDHSYRGYLEALIATRNNAWLPGPYAKKPAKILHNGYLWGNTSGEFQLQHAESHVMAQHVMAIIASVAAHPFAGAIPMRSYKQMMTRYSEFFWHEDIEIMKDGYKRFVADSMREIWYDDMIYRRETKDYADYYIHLVNTPEQEFCDDAVTVEPPVADDVEVSTKLFAAANAKAWVIKPYAWLAEVLEPTCTPVAAETAKEETVFKVPPFCYYSLLIIRVKK